MTRFDETNTRRYVRCVVMDDAMYEPFTVVIVDTTLKPKEGQAVAVEKNGSVFVRYLQREHDRLVLAPHNKEYRKTTLTKQHNIIGCAVRTYSRL